MGQQFVAALGATNYAPLLPQCHRDLPPESPGLLGTPDIARVLGVRQNRRAGHAGKGRTQRQGKIGSTARYKAAWMSF